MIAASSALPDEIALAGSLAELRETLFVTVVSPYRSRWCGPFRIRYLLPFVRSRGRLSAGFYWPKSSNIENERAECNGSVDYFLSRGSHEFETLVTLLSL